MAVMWDYVLAHYEASAYIMSMRRTVKTAAWRTCTHKRLSFVVVAGEITAHAPCSRMLSLSASCSAMFICLSYEYQEMRPLTVASLSR